MGWVLRLIIYDAQNAVSVTGDNGKGMDQRRVFAILLNPTRRIQYQTHPVARNLSFFNHVFRVLTCGEFHSCSVSVQRQHVTHGVLVNKRITRLRSLGVEDISEMSGIWENVVFPLRKGLIQPVSRAQ